MRPLLTQEKIRLYKFAKGTAIVLGAGLVGVGLWELVTSLISDPGSSSSWFGIFPIYIGAMLMLIAAAMTVDWFTNMRRYW